MQGLLIVCTLRLQKHVRIDRIAWTCYTVYDMLFPLLHHGVNAAFLSRKEEPVSAVQNAKRATEHVVLFSPLRKNPSFFDYYARRGEWRGLPSTGPATQCTTCCFNCFTMVPMLQSCREKKNLCQQCRTCVSSAECEASDGKCRTYLTTSG